MTTLANKWYVRVEGGLPVGNLISKNILHVAQKKYPESLFVECERSPLTNNVLPYQKITTTYVLLENKCLEQHSIEEMSEVEKQKKQLEVKQKWEATGLASWVFDEEKCDFYPPVQYPSDGGKYVWSEEKLTWVTLA